MPCASHESTPATVVESTCLHSGQILTLMAISADLHSARKALQVDHLLAFPHAPQRSCVLQQNARGCFELARARTQRACPLAGPPFGIWPTLRMITSSGDVANSRCPYSWLVRSSTNRIGDLPAEADAPTIQARLSRARLAATAKGSSSARPGPVPTTRGRPDAETVGELLNSAAIGMIRPPISVVAP